MAEVFLSENCIYLDYNATTPTDPLVAHAMLPYLTGVFGNPSSGHAYGVTSRKAVEKARKEVAELINCTPEEIIFTSGGTESNNIALQGAIRHLKKTNRGNHVITTTIEHWCTIGTLEDMQENEGIELTKVGVSKDGVVNLEELKNAIQPGKTILVSVMHANNQIGSIQPINEIGKICAENDIVFHTDAIQTAGKIPINVEDMQVDLLTIASHKLYGPKGAGALYVRKKPSHSKADVELSCVMHGAHQERGLRGGTENVLAIVGFGKACSLAKSLLHERAEHSRDLRNYLLEVLQSQLHHNDKDKGDEHSAMVVIGNLANALPNTLPVSFPHVKSFEIIQLLKNEVAFSAGAACSSGLTISSTLRAMGIAEDVALGMVRLSVGQFLSRDDAKTAALKIANAVQSLTVKQ